MGTRNRSKETESTESDTNNVEDIVEVTDDKNEISSVETVVTKASLKDFEVCENHLKNIIGGNFYDLVVFTPALYQYMVRDLPDDPLSLSKEIGLRAASILTKTKELCDEEEKKHMVEETFPKTTDSITLIGIGCVMRYKPMIPFGLLLSLKMLLNTDRMHSLKSIVESNRIALFMLVFIVNMEFSVWYNLMYLCSCVMVWEMKNFV